MQIFLIVFVFLSNGKVCLSLLGTWSGEKGESWNSKTSTLLQVLFYYIYYISFLRLFFLNINFFVGFS